LPVEVATFPALETVDIVLPEVGVPPSPIQPTLLRKDFTLWQNVAIILTVIILFILAALLLYCCCAASKPHENKVIIKK
jgi:hypothetical protein